MLRIDDEMKMNDCKLVKHVSRGLRCISYFCGSQYKRLTGYGQTVPYCDVRWAWLVSVSACRHNRPLPYLSYGTRST